MFSINPAGSSRCTCAHTPCGFARFRRRVSSLCTIPTRSVWRIPTRQYRIPASFSMSSVTGRRRGSAGCGGSPSGSRPARGRRSCAQSQSLSWCYSPLCFGFHAILCRNRQIMRNREKKGSRRSQISILNFQKVYCTLDGARRIAAARRRHNDTCKICAKRYNQWQNTAGKPARKGTEHESRTICRRLPGRPGSDPRHAAGGLYLPAAGDARQRRNPQSPPAISGAEHAGFGL